MNKDRFKFRAPYFKNNEFDGFVYFEAGYDCKKPSDHGYLGQREQCTGLKDKNGKLIFENDVLDDDFVIVWADWGWGFKRSGVVTMFQANMTHFEVTGNIHKNPEFLI